MAEAIMQQSKHEKIARYCTHHALIALIKEFELVSDS